MKRRSQRPFQYSPKNAQPSPATNSCTSGAAPLSARTQRHAARASSALFAYQDEARAELARHPERREGVEVPLKVGRRRGEKSCCALAIGSPEGPV